MIPLPNARPAPSPGARFFFQTFYKGSDPFQTPSGEKHGFAINGGYGKIKGKTFRISNMGNETEATMQELIDAMDEVLGS